MESIPLLVVEVCVFKHPYIELHPSMIYWDIRQGHWKESDMGVQSYDWCPHQEAAPVLSLPMWKNTRKHHLWARKQPLPPMGSTGASTSRTVVLYLSNTVPHLWWPPSTIKLFCTVLIQYNHNCNVATIISYSVNIWYTGNLLCNSQRDHNSTDWGSMLWTHWEHVSMVSANHLHVFSYWLGQVGLYKATDTTRVPSTLSTLDLVSIRERKCHCGNSGNNKSVFQLLAEVRLSLPSRQHPSWASWGWDPLILCEPHRKPRSMARAEMALGHLCYKNKGLTAIPWSQDVNFVTCVSLAYSESRVWVTRWQVWGLFWWTAWVYIYIYIWLEMSKLYFWGLRTNEQMHHQSQLYN
jgi:hypothetical protein